MRPTILLIIFLLIILLMPVDNLQCYQCNSIKDKQCDDEDEISTNYLKDCVAESEPPPDEGDEEPGTSEEPPGAEDVRRKRNMNMAKTHEKLGNAQDEFKCRKITQTLYITDPYETYVFRECASEFFQDECNSTSNKMFYLSICDCGENACNRAQLLWSCNMFYVNFCVVVYYFLLAYL